LAICCQKTHFGAYLLSEPPNDAEGVRSSLNSLGTFKAKLRRYVLPFV